jgi:hypothetical protein
VFHYAAAHSVQVNQTRRRVTACPQTEPELLSAYQEKIPARNAIYAHAQDFLAGDELLLAILKAFIPQPLNKQKYFMCSDEFSVIQCGTLSQHPQYTVQVHSLHAVLNCLMFSVCVVV